ncbi:hypothetical protein [Herbaspirillum huttiense]|uniref:hypothetical protein n=1 Tax=Herbaspirillum huttiense TaxID=863372 RepID=UPI000584AAB2|nr:hypothetical protein [Herbaspirillum huttiense]
MRTNQFTRPTLAAATELLGVSLTQGLFGQMLFRLTLGTRIPADDKISVTKKVVLLNAILETDGQVQVATLDGQMTLIEAVVMEAVSVTQENSRQHAEHQSLLERALALDGFVIEWAQGHGSKPRLRAALPSEVDLPDTDDEVHLLLKHFNFTVSLGHLDQAIDAHTRGNWAGANSQTRTFMESLFDSIAIHIDASTASGNSENRRAFLATKQFFSVDRNEWTADGKNYINGLFKMLHTEGSHPGLSDEDRSTFRLHVVLVTARTFLRRLKNNQ